MVSNASNPAVTFIQTPSDDLMDSLSQDESLKSWINNRVPVAKLDMVYADGYEFETCLGYACSFCPVERVILLVEAGASVKVTNGHGESALHRACMSFDNEERLEKVTFLISVDSSLVHARDTSNKTPLHTAASYGNHDVIGALVSSGADVNASGPDGRTALQYAVEGSAMECMAQLMRHGANVDARNQDQYTPLHKAADQDLRECITALTQLYNADINIQGLNGDTPLHVAASLGRLDAVKTLTSDPRCNIYRQNENFQTALEFAVEREEEAVVQYLQNLCDNPTQ